MKKLIIFLTALLGLIAYVAASHTYANNEPKTGFESPAYKHAYVELKHSFPRLADLQFCRSGAAFVIAGLPEYAEQYQADHGHCIKVLVRLYKGRTPSLINPTYEASEVTL